MFNSEYVTTCFSFLNQCADVRGRKKWENSCEYFTLSLRKTLVNCILIKSSSQPLTQQSQKSLELFCSNSAIL